MLVRAGHASSVTLRQPALPRPVRTWSLTTLREKLIKIGAKVVHHARAVTFQLAEVAVPRELFAALLALGSVGCARRRAPGDRSSRAAESGVEPRRTGMVRGEQREPCRETSREGPSGCPAGHPALPTAPISPFFLGQGDAAGVQCVLRRARRGPRRRGQRSSGKSRIKSWQQDGD